MANCKWTQYFFHIQTRKLPSECTDRGPTLFAHPRGSSYIFVCFFWLLRHLWSVCRSARFTLSLKFARTQFIYAKIRIYFDNKRNYSGHFSLKTQCTARCSRACDSVKGEHLIYNRTPANSRFSEKNKNRKNPLRLMQNGSDEPLILWLDENPASKLGNFQPVTASPYRVLHQVQGDKQEKLATVTIMEYSVRRLDNSLLFAAVSLVQSWKGSAVSLAGNVFSVYRLEEDVSLLKEGGVRLLDWALRACSYKTKTKA